MSSDISGESGASGMDVRVWWEGEYLSGDMKGRMETKKILITGASGLIGSALARRLEEEGCQVVRLGRRSGTEQAGEPHWDPAKGELRGSDLEGFDAVIHLAGENLAAGRWTDARMRALRESRVAGTQLLCSRLADLGQPPKVLVNASAIGFYGSRGEEVLTEASVAGAGFLADLGAQWEKAAVPAIGAGIRVVFARFGIVLSAHGGALGKMVPLFRLGLGGVLGNGRQFWSWIEIGDAVEALLHILRHEALSGPVNVVSPQPVSNREFTQVLGRVLARPTVFPVPGPILRCAVGRMADEALLASQRVAPEKLIGSGFKFRYPNLEGAMRHQLGRE